MGNNGILLYMGAKMQMGDVYAKINSEEAKDALSDPQSK
jgi:hypothetical protein